MCNLWKTNVYICIRDSFERRGEGGEGGSDPLPPLGGREGLTTPLLLESNMGEISIPIKSVRRKKRRPEAPQKENISHNELTFSNLCLEDDSACGKNGGQQ